MWEPLICWVLLILSAVAFAGVYLFLLMVPILIDKYLMEKDESEHKSEF